MPGNTRDSQGIGPQVRSKITRSSATATIIGVGLAAALLAACGESGVSGEQTEASATATTPPGEATAASSSSATAPASTSNTSNTSNTSEEPTTPAPQSDEELRAQVASLMMVGVTSYEDALAKLEQGAGGIFITSRADPSILSEPGRDIAALREAVGRDFSVSIDFEGGRVQRHTEVFGSWPSPRQLAETMTPEQVRQEARRMGEALAAHGITVNFAPVVDLDIAGLDIVGDRSFSEDPQVAATYATAFAQGMEEAGVTPVFKHFPGHGQASGDTHEGLAVTPPLQTLKQQDLLPFGEVFANAPGQVMIGHMAVPGLGNENVPSSLDPATYELLRSGDYPQGVPFDGIAYTDDLSGMAAVTDRVSTPDAAVAAIAAGADQPLWSSDQPLDEVVDAVVTAVDDGEIPQERINDAAERVRTQLE